MWMKNPIFTLALALSPMLTAAAQPYWPEQPPPPPPAPAAAAPQVFAFTSSGSYLGVGVQEVTAESAKKLKLAEERGVEITRVDNESPASKAGLKVGDVVLDYNGQRVEGADQFVRFVRETPAGRTVKLNISREGKGQNIAAVIGQRKGSMTAGNYGITIPDIRVPMPQIAIDRFDIPMASMSWRSPSLGVVGEAVEDQLAAYFGVKEGVLVRSVVSDSAAEKAGIKAGDVIVKVDDDKVTTPREITSSLRTGGKKTVNVVLMRDRKEVTVSVNLPEPPERRPAGRATRVTTPRQFE